MAISQIDSSGLATGAVAQVDLAAGVAGNGPAFSATGSGQSISNSTLTKITLGTVEYDTNSNFSSSRFTPTVAGYYLITGSVGFSGSPTGTFYSRIYKNGSVATNGQGNTPQLNSISMAATATCIVYLNGSTDYIELYGVQVSGGALTGNGALQGVLMRAA